MTECGNIVNVLLHVTKILYHFLFTLPYKHIRTDRLSHPKGIHYPLLQSISLVSSLVNQTVFPFPSPFHSCMHVHGIRSSSQDYLVSWHSFNISPMNPISSIMITYPFLPFLYRRDTVHSILLQVMEMFN